MQLVENGFLAAPASAVWNVLAAQATASAQRSATVDLIGDYTRCFATLVLIGTQTNSAAAMALWEQLERDITAASLARVFLRVFPKRRETRATPHDAAAGRAGPLPSP